ncbi:MAG: tetraacyldisaccharide 4'-kinase [Phycisphaerales bacterium JB040]
MTPPREKPAPTLLSPLARAAEPLYRWEITRRNRAFDRGEGVTTLDRPVLSVGNLSVGGTGKTPTVRRLLSWLLEAGHRPCVAMRGYKSTPAVESDEAAAHRRAFPTVPIVAQPDRIAGLHALFETQVGRDTDCVVLDDGFQHRRLGRDFDLVLVDASRNPFRDRLIPAGWLREPVESLARASAVVVTHAELATPEALERLCVDVERAHARPPLAVTTHDWTELDVLAETGESTKPVSILRGTRSLAVCAIGNPHAFIDSARGAVGDGRLETIVLRDHDPYKPPTLEAIIEHARLIDAHTIITTDKDWSKLADVAPDRWPCPVARPRLRLGFARGEEALREAVLGAVR